MRKFGGAFLATLLAVAVVSGACGDDDDEADNPAITQTTISSGQTSVAPMGVTTTSIAGGITTVQ